MARVAALTLLTVLSCGQPAVEQLRPTRVEQDAATPLVTADQAAHDRMQVVSSEGREAEAQDAETAASDFGGARAAVSAPGIDTTGIESTIRDVFGPTHGPRAVRVARCETGGWRPDVIYGPATGSAGERGAYQAHPGHWRGDWGGPRRERVHGYTFDEMWEPEKAARWAFAHSKGGRDWSQWSCA